MSSKKKTPIHLEDLTPDEKVKYEIAEELGLLDRVMQDGWKSLTSKETRLKLTPTGFKQFAPSL